MAVASGNLGGPSWRCYSVPYTVWLERPGSLIAARLLYTIFRGRGTFGLFSEKIACYSRLALSGLFKCGQR